MKRSVLAFACLALLVAGTGAAIAQASTADIVCGLDPACTRHLSRALRGVTATGGTDPNVLSVNLYVNFAYDSAELTSDARITLDRLGYALLNDRLKGFAFMIERTMASVSRPAAVLPTLTVGVCPAVCGNCGEICWAAAALPKCPD